ncbi:MAG: amino acid adenylation domain-containing protein, partial [Lachnospiraceae bacterium]|nr:amino acid adenylation domain-containing protein [Lachnospiraceae bacterium]
MADTEGGVSSMKETHIQTIGEAVAEYRNSVKTAVVCGGQRLSYQELWERSERIARNLIREGLEKGDRVILDMERSADCVCMFLGLARAGGIAVYIHRGWPEKQRVYVIESCRPRRIVNDETARALMQEKSFPGNEAAALPEVRGEDPFQIVYTSGSTGRPKGTVLAHRTAVNDRLPSQVGQTGAEHGARRLVDHDFSFVASTIFLLHGLFCEKTLVIPTGEELLNAERLAALIEREDVTEVFWMSSRFLRLLSEPAMAAAVRRFRMFVFAGEKTPKGLLAAARKYMPEAELFNVYAMSELMVVGVYLLGPENENLFAGSNEGIGLHLLDERGEPVAGGETGELCVSGPPARLGYYWAEPEETERRYTLHPVLGRIFHTGDMAVAEKGGFRMKGRVDQMAKLRGMRIDLGAVEKAMLAQAEIRAAVALITGEGERQILCAYYTRDPEADHTAPGAFE